MHNRTHLIIKLKASALLFSAFILPIICAAQQGNISCEKNLCKKIDNKWLNHSLELTRNCVGFSAPVAARALCYFTIGMYESQVEIFPASRTLSGQLQLFQRKTWKDKNTKYYWPEVVNSCLKELSLYYYDNMPPANEQQTNALYNELRKEYRKNSGRKQLARSALYGEALALEIEKWSEIDNGHQGYNRNFPESYSPANCVGCWQKTVPGYLSALQPYWGKNRLMLPTSAAISKDIPFTEFSSDSGSSFYLEAKQLVELYKHISPEQIVIAKYWDDSPGYSGTPAGHLYTLAMQLAITQNLPLERMLELYVLLGISMNEANIESWKLKYEYNLIRPVSYIQRYITPSFNTVLSTPPFPEFPSGHSYQSGAASQIFIHIFGDEMPFTDSVNLNRTDINGTPRKFQNFSSMAEEISISRYYGGIHFLNTLQVSLAYGRKMGNHIIENIQLQK